MSLSSEAQVRAVLGPTNTGKTYLAIERMLGHESGMIGFPLRLLARENYDRVAALRGAGSVALITGEERIVPDNPRYFLCTVEAMPMDRRVAFLAIDEIQLCADAERGHVFTDRLLHARGVEETMFLGAETMAPIIRKLVPEAVFERRERFSRLSYAGPKKITRLPPRSAVVAFSASNVYALAELLRRQRGGAAVVLGALSPRTRNAQVAMYEAGEVEYLVATDAIGMGLNMGIDHVAFSSLTKFDGSGFRNLQPAEIAQIAGRAGRHMADGTFGPTADLPPFDPELVAALEEHRFEPVQSIFWRASDLDFASPEALKRSLEAPPPGKELRRARAADDYSALTALIAQADIKALAATPEAVRTLWDVCRIPDFRGDLSGAHPRLVARLFRFLMAEAGRVPADWVSRAVDRLDRTDGDIDTLVARIAGVRTWTYISHRRNWLDDADALHERARALEDKLSDALHERLTQRFVDSRTAVLVRRLREQKDILAGVADDGTVTVEGAEVGRLEGFRFVPVDAEVAASPRLMAAANRALRESVTDRVAGVVAADDTAFSLALDGQILWRDAPLGRLTKGGEILRPNLEVLASELIDGPSREQLRQRLQGWWNAHLQRALAPLFRLRAADLSGGARGLAYRLVEGLGCTVHDPSFAPLKALEEEERKALARAGVRIGVECIYMPALMKGKSMALKTLLWVLHNGVAAPTPLPDGGTTSLPRDESVADSWYQALGLVPVGPLAVRADLLERLLADIRRRARDGKFPVSAELLSSIGATPEAFAKMLRKLGFAVTEEEGVLHIARRKRPRGKPQSRKPARKPKPVRIDPDSPFAKLAELRLGQS